MAKSIVRVTLMKLPIQTQSIKRGETGQAGSVYGLGDVVSHLTQKLGFRHCDACRRRAEFLNRLVRFPNSRIRNFRSFNHW
jgi:hypothetical protein